MYKGNIMLDRYEWEFSGEGFDLKVELEKWFDMAPDEVYDVLDVDTIIQQVLDEAYEAQLGE